MPVRTAYRYVDTCAKQAFRWRADVRQIAMESKSRDVQHEEKETKATYYDFVRKNKHEIQAGFGIYLDKKNAAGTFYK